MDYTLERYPKIAKIKNFILKRGISICQSDSDDNTKYGLLIVMTLIIKNEKYTVFVDDEYEDLKKKNSLLNFVLVFRELAMIADCSDFLERCSQHDLDPNTFKLLAYYKHISSKIEKIKLLFKNNTIDYFISDLDFQLNSGEIQLLRKYIVIENLVLVILTHSTSLLSSLRKKSVPLTSQKNFLE